MPVWVLPETTRRSTMSRSAPGAVAKPKVPSRRSSTTDRDTFLLAPETTKIVFPWFLGSANVAIQGLMSAILISFLVMHLIVVLHLAYPFVGETAISPSVFLVVAQ